MKLQERLIEKYGNPTDDPKAFAAKWLTVWECQKEFTWLPMRRVYIHKDFIPYLQKFYLLLEEKNLHHEIETFDGCWNIRFIRGYEKQGILSIHSWACAIDHNASENCLGCVVKFSPELLDCARKVGIRCGADFARKDGMHFEIGNF